ncbi:MAG: hypothetical protein QW589_04270 [Candidatus Bathyarchaeia archaeon]
MNAFTRLLEAIKANKLFKHNKVSLEDKVWAIIFYLAGLSLRAITEHYGLIKASKPLGYRFIRMK